MAVPTRSNRWRPKEESRKTKHFGNEEKKKEKSLNRSRSFETQSRKQSSYLLCLFPACMEISPPALFPAVHDLKCFYSTNTRQDAFVHSCFNTAMPLIWAKSKTLNQVWEILCRGWILESRPPSGRIIFAAGWSPLTMGGIRREWKCWQRDSVNWWRTHFFCGSQRQNP